MPDDKKAKDKTPDAETEQAPTGATPQGESVEGTATTSGSAVPQPAPLTYEQMERLRRKLKAKYH